MIKSVTAVSSLSSSRSSNVLLLKSTMSLTVCPRTVPVDMVSFTPQKGTVVTNITNIEPVYFFYTWAGERLTQRTEGISLDDCW